MSHESSIDNRKIAQIHEGVKADGVKPVVGVDLVAVLEAILSNSDSWHKGALLHNAVCAIKVVLVLYAKKRLKSNNKYI